MCLTLGRKVMDRVLGRLAKNHHTSVRSYCAARGFRIFARKRILAGIARAVITEGSRERLYAARTLDEALAVVGVDVHVDPPPRPRRASLADI